MRARARARVRGGLVYEYRAGSEGRGGGARGEYSTHARNEMLFSVATLFKRNYCFLFIWLVKKRPSALRSASLKS